VDTHEPRTPARSPESDLPAKVPRRFVGEATTPSPAPKREKKSPEARSWDKLLLVVGAAVAVAAVLIVPGILNKGGQNPVAEAAQATMDSSGVRMNFTMSMQGPVQITMQGSGAMNGETKRVSLHMQANGGAAGGFQMDEVVDGDLNVYMHSPVFSSVAGGKSWLLIKGSAWGDLPGSDALAGAGMSFGPKQQLDALESVSDGVSVVGHEPVNGVSTTHYSASIDIGKVTGQLPDKLREVVGDAMDGLSAMPVDVWVDDQGLLRREQSTFTLGPLGSMSMTIDFSDYGTHPQIDLPAESDVYDVTSLIQDQLGS
jgi:hypothetical protein